MDVLPGIDNSILELGDSHIFKGLFHGRKLPPGTLNSQCLLTVLFRVINVCKYDDIEKTHSKTSVRRYEFASRLF